MWLLSKYTWWFSLTELSNLCTSRHPHPFRMRDNVGGLLKCSGWAISRESGGDPTEITPTYFASVCRRCPTFIDFPLMRILNTYRIADSAVKMMIHMLATGVPLNFSLLLLLIRRRGMKHVIEFGSYIHFFSVTTSAYFYFSKWTSANANPLKSLFAQFLGMWSLDYLFSSHFFSIEAQFLMTWKFLCSMKYLKRRTGKQVQKRVNVSCF